MLELRFCIIDHYIMTARAIYIGVDFALWAKKHVRMAEKHSMD